jgi:NTE family protein
VYGTEDYSFWSDLSQKDQLEIRSAMLVRRVAGGETLIEQGSLAQAMFIVNFGRFEVKNFAKQVTAEVGAGQLIGEIGFFAGEPRTASVVAPRDSEVLEINRAQFDALAARIPGIQHAVTRALAKRLAHLASIRRDNESATTLNTTRVIAVVAAGSGEMSGDFVARLREAFAAHSRTCFLTSEDAVPVSQGRADSDELANWLCKIELKHDLVVCVAESALTAWTHTVLRSADQVLLVAAGSPDMLNPVESLALEIFSKARRRLVRVETRRLGCAPPSRPWLRRREVFMIHHLSMQDQDDFHSLWRFLTGQAIGLVAGGGGAFCPCHVGIFNAFQEAGVAFDIFGGSSAGSVMAAGFACLTETEVFKSALHDIFVRRRALSRFTLPRYGLLDHRVLEDELQRRNPGDIEDLWRPFFATAADLSTDTLRVLREGPLWQAIRASCSLPAVLPPFIDDAGHMLVDGGVRDNLPVGVMNSLKSGPNLVIDLQPTKHQLFNFSYRSIPGRGELIAHMLNPWPWKKALPPCPGPATVLARSLSRKIIGKVEKKNPLELVLQPPVFPGSSFMDWSRYADIMDASYEWGRKTVETLRENGDPALAAMLSLSDPSSNTSRPLASASCERPEFGFAS